MDFQGKKKTQEMFKQRNFLLKTFLIQLTGFKKVQLLQYKINNNVDHAGLSQQLGQWKVLIFYLLVHSLNYLNSNAQIVSPKIKVAMVAGKKTVSIMLNKMAWTPKNSILILGQLTLVLLQNMVRFWSKLTPKYLTTLKIL